MHIPKIVTFVDDPLYSQAIQAILKKILAPHSQQFPQLPLIASCRTEQMPVIFSFQILYQQRPHAFKFVFEMISRWLAPGRPLPMASVFSADFSMPELRSEPYTLCEIKLQVGNEADLAEIQRNLPLIESELRLGIESRYYARRILEIKGQSADEKIAAVQEHIVHLVKRFPKEFDMDILTEMQHVFVISRDDFKTHRDSRHISRIIGVQYLFRKRLRETIEKAPEKRHLRLKLYRTQSRRVGIIVGVNFLEEQEIFEKRHLLTAIQNYIPTAQAVEDSFFANNRGHDTICLLYLEIEKGNGDEFSRQEIKTLLRELPIDLKDRIEHLMHPVFMPRNEEEIVRNVLSLSNQIKFIRDIPQVTINFDEQTPTSLFFTIILVRVMKPDSMSIQDLFRRYDSFLNYIHDRTRSLGFLRKKYLKEATVFRVKLSKEQFLRRDHSIDLNKARLTIFNELTRILGDLRDYNGGMISKQNELLSHLRELLGDRAKFNELLLEDFFYSLMPVIMRTVMDPRALKMLFLMNIEAIEKGFFTGEEYSIKIKNDTEFVYVMIKGRELSIKEELGRIFNKLQVPSSDLTESYVKVYEASYMGYIYRCDDAEKQKEFCYTLQNVLQAWEHKKHEFCVRMP